MNKCIKYIKAKYHKYKNFIKYLRSPREYYGDIQICGWGAKFLPRFIEDRMGIKLPKGKAASFNTYSLPTVLYYHRAPVKLFYTQENTHVDESYWQQFENVWLKEPSLSLTCGFDYAEHPKYIRVPYWIEHVFGPMATKQDVVDFVANHDIPSDAALRTNDCAFICKKDYFGDRAVMSDLVAQIMPMSYPSDFRHNDDDMRGKFGDDKIVYLRHFKFNLCPENSNNRGYVTEKVFEAIKAGCVPIYWGNEGYPEPDILNPDAIVYLDKDNPDEGLALLQKLYEDPKAYKEFASQPRFMPGAEEKIYGYYERLENKLKEILS